MTGERCSRTPAGCSTPSRRTPPPLPSPDRANPHRSSTLDFPPPPRPAAVRLFAVRACLAVPRPPPPARKQRPVRRPLEGLLEERPQRPLRQPAVHRDAGRRRHLPRAVQGLVGPAAQV